MVHSLLWEDLRYHAGLRPKMVSGGLKASVRRSHRGLVLLLNRPCGTWDSALLASPREMPRLAPLVGFRIDSSGQEFGSLVFLHVCANQNSFSFKMWKNKDGIVRSRALLEKASFGPVPSLVPFLIMVLQGLRWKQAWCPHRRLAECIVCLALSRVSQHSVTSHWGDTKQPQGFLCAALTVWLVSIQSGL